MKIAIIEFETHSHLLILWDQLLSSLDNLEYKFFLSQTISDQTSLIEDKNKQVIDISLDNSLLENQLKGYEIVFFNTLHRNFERFGSIFFNYKTYILVHNCNFYFKSNKPIWRYVFMLKNKKLVYYYLKLIYKEQVYKTKNYIQQAKGYAFLNDEMYKRNKQEDKFNFVLPLLYNQYFQELEELESINVVIPGIISEDRREYILLFEVLKKINPKEKINIIFLGRPENKSTLLQLEQIRRLVISKIKIFYLKDRIPQHKFDRYMQTAHFILCPIKKETQFYLQQEFYGKTKVSGNEMDCIYYGKIGIFPETYSIDNWEIISYKSKTQLQNILENLTFEEYKLRHYKLAEKISFFSKENSQNRMKDILKQIVLI